MNPVDEYHNLELYLIMAIHGIGRRPAERKEIVALKQEILRAKDRCKALNLKVESIHKTSQDRRDEAEKRIRSSFKKVQRPWWEVTRERRKIISIVSGFSVGLAIFMNYNLSVITYILALVGGLFTCAGIELLIMHILPSVPCRSAILAFRSRVDVGDIWKDDDRKDYYECCRFFCYSSQRRILRIR